MEKVLCWLEPGASCPYSICQLTRVKTEVTNEHFLLAGRSLVGRMPLGPQSSILGALQDGLIAKHRFVHALDNPTRVGFAQVGIALDHRKGLVPQHLGYL